MNQKYEQMKCIWMGSAGVDYKLCDRNFDCDNCQFDRVIRNMLSEEQNNGGAGMQLLSRCASGLKAEQYDPSWVWFKNQLVGKPMFGRTSSIGLSPLVRHLLDESTTVRSNQSAETVSRGETLFSLEGEWGKVDVPAPVNLSVCNFFLPDGGALRSSNQWLALVMFDSKDKNECVMTRQEFETHRDTLLEYLLSFDFGNLPVGETMHDGANPAKSLHAITGSHNFRRLLASLVEGI